MSRSRRRLVFSLSSVLTLASGTYALAQDASVQSDSGPIKCYAETCDGTLCVRQEIRCPATLIPVS